MSRARGKNFTVTLTPAMYDGIVAAMVALDMEREGWVESQDWTPDTRRESRNAAAAFNRIRDAYHKANPTEGGS